LFSKISAATLKEITLAFVRASRRHRAIIPVNINHPGNEPRQKFFSKNK